MRRTWLIVLAIALGALTTVAMAWMFAAFQSVPMYGGTAAAFAPRPYASAFIWNDGVWSVNGITGLGYDDHWWMNLHVDVPPNSPLRDNDLALLASWGARVQQHSPQARVGSSQPSWGTFTLESPPPREHVIGSDTAFGWPWPCLWYQVRGQVINNSTANSKLYGGIHLRGAVDTRGRDFHALPLRPIWPSLAANIAMFSLAWWLVPMAIFTARRRLRIRRGACPACGYSLQGGSKVGCSECGWSRSAISSSHAP